MHGRPGPQNFASRDAEAAASAAATAAPVKPAAPVTRRMVMDRTGKLVDLEKMPPEEIARALPGMLFTGTNLLLCSEYTHLKALICD